MKEINDKLSYIKEKPAYTRGPIFQINTAY